MTITKFPIPEKTIPDNFAPGKFYLFINCVELDQVCQIQADFFCTHFSKNEHVVFVPVEIAGAVMYPNNLIKYISHPERLDIAYVDVMFFKNEQRLKTMSVHFSPKLPEVVRRKKIVIIDTMFDKGNTIFTLLDIFSKSPFNPTSISVFTMINKHDYDQLKTKMSEYHLFYQLAPFIKVPEKLWYRGYGLDDKRLLPYIEAKNTGQKIAKIIKKRAIKYPDGSFLFFNNLTI